MRRLWQIFAQAVTVSVAVLFVVQTLKPEWLDRRSESGEVSIQQAAKPDGTVKAVASYADAARKAVPAVVFVYTSQQVKTPSHPLLSDPFFRHFFGDQLGEETQRRSGLGSGVIVSSDGYIILNAGIFRENYFNRVFFYVNVIAGLCHYCCPAANKIFVNILFFNGVYAIGRIVRATP